jgi:EAL domain-containing protein (putative c-di-GMP-specific phosphodiesterase class I)
VYCTSPSFSADDLLRDADIALYQAKRQGKAQYAVFTPSLNAQAHRRLELEAGIRRGLTAGEFRLVYQPIVDLNSEKLVGLEALARWDRPHEGAVQPTEFIPIAEETGLIHPLGQWILEEACRQARAWQLAFPSNPARTISVNLSAKQFRHPTLVADLARTLRATGLDPASLELEITESIAMENGEATFKVLRELKRLGVKLAIDDFGTGYSSLAYLRRFPIDTLKIDGSFVERLGQHPEDTAIVQAITTLANTLNVQIIAEGIETPKQLSYLQMLGAQLGQGYLFAHPMRPESVRTHLAQLDMGLQPAPALAEV